MLRGSLVLVLVLALAAGMGALLLLGGEPEEPAARAEPERPAAPTSEDATLRTPLEEAPEGAHTAELRETLPDAPTAVADLEKRDEPRLDEPKGVAPDFPLPTVDVYALTPDGVPLVTAAAELLAGLELDGHASIDPPRATLPPRPVPPEPEARAALLLGSQEADGQLATLHLRADPPLWIALALGRNVLATEPLESGAERVDFRVAVDALTAHLGALTFRVVDGPTGRPLPGAHALVKTQSARAQLSVQADAQGRVRLDPWYAGPGKAMLWSQEKSWQWFELVVLPGGESDVGDLELWPAPLVQGALLGPGGEPLPNADFQYACDADPASQRIGVTGEHGTFAFPAQPGRWTLRAVPPEEYPRHAFRDVTFEVERSGAPPFVRVQLEPGATMLLEATEPWARRAQFRVSIPGGEVVRAGNLLHATSWRTRLPLGPYDVELVDATGSVLQRVELDHTETGTRIVLDRL